MSIDMDQVRSFRDLEVWRLSMDLAEAVYRLSKGMPRTELSLRSQMRSAAISIPANVAEGYGRMKRRQAYQNHISIAMGSLAELDTELELALRTGIVHHDEAGPVLALLPRVGAMLYRLHESLAS